MLLAVCLLKLSDVYLDYSNEKARKGFCFGSLGKDVINHKALLIGAHAFTSNDYVSSFSRKGKSTCFVKNSKNQNFIEAFEGLGDSLGGGGT